MFGGATITLGIGPHSSVWLSLAVQNFENTKSSLYSFGKIVFLCQVMQCVIFPKCRLSPMSRFRKLSLR